MKLSIITINYNNAAGLKKTMQSVLSQTSKEFEYIVVDGASTDGSKDLIERLAISDKRISYWISEPDNGIYHAMNKGIQLAQGEFVQFVNSGDCLVDNRVIENVLKEMPVCDIFMGKRISVREDGKKRVEPHPANVNLYTFYKSGLQHPTAYIRRSLFEKYGLYDESLRIASDWKWFLLVVGLNRVELVCSNLHVSYFDLTGLSSTQIEASKAERRKVLEEMLPPSVLFFFDQNYTYINQIERIRRYPILYAVFSLLERLLFKYEQFKKNIWR